ncbi:hypothetical protein B0I35DRAFT_479336 [Stachybotrys elegans]|uniref:Carrier domain-containing protein n=1 Tax=Stachybotrys elegans TaxID=80388 RepID=A0A8K0WPI4_9HYPO|nr:hypothetical protein B0I35DRAFT_479336 [Stachybotrys elegans]
MAEMTEDVAVIGLAVRFPGRATSPEELWKVLASGESEWSPFPSDRLNIDGYYHPSGDRLGSISFRGAHFLKEDVAAFDASFFGITADEANSIDPQQRLLLEVCYEAIENAGLRKEDLDGSDTSVHVGSFVKDYEQVCLRDPDWQPRYAATGNGIAIMANRLSYFFNLRGPSMTLDTGCSGSLVSVHLGAQCLRNGESSIAIAAGSGMILTPSTIMPMTALNFLSPDGKCFTFDERANGYGRGEGVGVVIMKRLRDAIRDGDPIRSVIRGSRVNQDGRTTGITLPSKEAQVANIQAVYKAANLSFQQTAFVECHGTGTQAGDWRELKAISETLASERETHAPIVVGSLKPNIGHLEGAAGIAGLIKGVLVLEHGQIPPNINFKTGNPNIDFAGWKVKVPRTLMEWPLLGVRRASINCFGFGGTNAHVIMDEAPSVSQKPVSNGLKSSQQSVDTVEGAISDDQHRHQSLPRLFAYSSHEKLGVRRIMNAHLPYLEAHELNPPVGLLQNYSFTLGCHRSNFEWKGAVVAETVSELIEKIRNIDRVQVTRSTPGRVPKISFVFGGQGSQWAQMGMDLMRFDVFSNSIHEANVHLKTVLGSPFNLLEEIRKDSSQSRLDRPELSQPATTVVQVALVQLLSSLGIHPRVVIGHSSGEVAAAFAAGALTRQDAWEVAYFRGLVAARIPHLTSSTKGGMMVIGLSQQETQAYLQSMGQVVEVACINSPRSTTVSGPSDSIRVLASDLERKCIFHRVLKVEVAYHSSQMASVSHDYEMLISQVRPQNITPSIKMISSVTGCEIEGPDLVNTYWSRNMVSPVNYVAAINCMLELPEEQRPDVVLELSPSAALHSPTMDIITAHTCNLPIGYFSIMGPREKGAVLVMRTLAELWCQGVGMNMKAIATYGTSDQPRCLSDLPPYPWNHDKRYWHESHLNQAIRFRRHPRKDLIGCTEPGSHDFQPRWRGFLRASENPWMVDHQVQKTVVYPAAGMVSMVLEAAQQMSEDVAGISGYEITDMSIDKAMVIPGTAHGLEVNISFTNASSLNDGIWAEPARFDIFSKPLDKPWERHASGYLQFRSRNEDWKRVLHHHNSQHTELKRACRETLIPRQLYELLDVVGISYGPLFQNVKEIHKTEGACTFGIQVPDTRSRMPAKYEYPHLIHPATLDAMFHSLFAIEPRPMVPTFIKKVVVSSNLGCQAKDMFYGHGTAELVGHGDAKGTLYMAKSGLAEACVIVDGLHLSSLKTMAEGAERFLPNHHNLCTEIQWQEDPTFRQSGWLGDYVSLLSHKYPGLSILLAGFDESLISLLLKALTPKKDDILALSRLTVICGTDQSSDCLAFVDGTVFENRVEAKHVDDLGALPTYHLIIHLDQSSEGLPGLEQKLKPGGLLLMSHSPLGNANLSSMVHEVPRSHQINGSHNQLGMPVIQLHAQYEDKTLTFEGRDASSQISWRNGQEIVVIQPDTHDEDIQSFINNLEQLFISLHCGLTVTAKSWSSVVADPAGLAGKVAISLNGLVVDDESYSSVYDWKEADFQAFHTLQDMAKGLLWITRSAHMNPRESRGSPIVALARTLISEDPLKLIVTLDLDQETRLVEPSLPLHILRILRLTFGKSEQPGPRDMEFAEKEGKIYIPRLYPIVSLNRLIEDDLPPELVSQQFKGQHGKDSKALRLTAAGPGAEEAGFFYTETQLPGLQPHDIEIGFKEASLTIADINNSIGGSVEGGFGLDVCGKVLRVGTEVAKFKPGDQVAALTLGGSIQNILQVDEQDARPYRPGLILSHLTSAFYALVHVGRLRRGRTVLVHAGASPYGLAALEIANITGAEIFVTTLGAGAEEQRSLLLRAGISEDHIMDGNAENFVEYLLAMTGRKGVDCAFNPTQSNIDSTLECVRTCGSVVQLASRSISRRSQKPLPGSITLVNLDFEQLLHQDRDFVRELVSRTMDFIGHRELDLAASATNATVFSPRDVFSAVRAIEKSPYFGHVVIRDHPGSSVEVMPLHIQTSKPLKEVLRQDGTYLLIGGLGGLGRSITKLLISHGARHVAFVSRSGASSHAAQSWVDDLREKDVDVRVYQVDICDSAALSTAMDQICLEMPPIHGVFQCAAVIRDAVFDNMTWSDWSAAIQPKTTGSWNIVQAATKANKDTFFVFLSSSACVIGNRGQANYAAGNCFQDALARSLRLQGTHAVSIDLGPVLGAGMLEHDDAILDILRASGFYGIRHDDFLKVITHAITMEISPGVAMPPQVTLGVGTGGLMYQNKPADPYWTRTALFSHLNIVDMPAEDLAQTSTASYQAQDMKTMLATSQDAAAAADIVTSGLVGMLARSMNTLPEDIDPSKPPTAYGVDSLVAVGLRTWVLGNCGIEVSVFEILSDNTVAELAAQIVGKGGYGQETNAKGY